MTDILKICQRLAAEKLPFPVMECEQCRGMIFRKDQWFQCPDCGALTTAFGGLFTHVEASEDWKAECQQSRRRMKEIAQEDQGNDD